MPMPPPRGPRKVAPLARRLLSMPMPMPSRVIGFALHAFLLVLPPLGYLAASTMGSQVRLFGTLALPAIAMPPRAELAIWLATAHRILAWSFLACTVIHVGVVLYHHLVVRDRMLRRMLPPW